jgi:hypothetical protein
MDPIVGLFFMVGDPRFTFDASTCGAMLPPGVGCTVQVRFAPTGPGLVTSTLTVTAGADTAVLQLAGTGEPGEPPPPLSFTPTNLDFGTVAVGATSVPLSATLQNAGTDPIVGLFFTAGDPRFTFDASACGAMLMPGAGCTVQIRFAPTGPGPVASTLTVTAGADTAVLQLSGTGSALSSLSFTPTNLDFGPVAIGTTSEPLSATLQNMGTDPIVGLFFTAGDPRFTFDASACGAMLMPGAGCTVQIRFAPTGPGPIASTLTVTAGANTAVLQLSGTGSAPSSLSFTPASLDFGSVAIGASSVPLLATLENTGMVPVAGLFFMVGDPQFTFDASACGASLMPGAGCAVLVTFVPTGPGPVVSTLTVTAGTDTAVLQLGGTGAPPSSLSFTPASLEFGLVAVGTTSEPLPATLQNTGTNPIVGLFFMIGDPRFTFDASACGAMLAPGAGCTVQVRFAPTEPGPVASTLTVTAGIDTALLQLGGTGEPGEPPPPLAFTPTSLDFGTVAVGATSVPLLATLQNTGTDSIAGLSFMVGDPQFTFDASACGLILEAGASCAALVWFAPTASGPVVSTLTVTAGADTAVLQLGGTGAPPPPLSFAPASLDFGLVAVGTTSEPLSAVLTNTGDQIVFGLFLRPPENGFAIEFTSCGPSIEPGASCSMDLTFSPTTEGHAESELEVSSIDGRIYLDLFGNGIVDIGPIASVAPKALKFVVEQGGSESAKLEIANIGSSPLTWGIAEGGATGIAQQNVDDGYAIPEFDDPERAPSEAFLVGADVPRMVIPLSDEKSGIDRVFALDSGAYDSMLGLADRYDVERAAIWLNRFVIPEDSTTLTIDRIAAVLPQSPEFVGLQLNLLVYYDADGDGDPSNALRIGRDRYVTIDAIDRFVSWPVDFRVAGPGDVYLGYESAYARTGASQVRFPVAIDRGAVRHRHSWMGAKSDGVVPDLEQLGNNDLSGFIEDFGVTGTWLIRATGSRGQCPDPYDVPWLTPAAAGGTLAPNEAQTVAINADTDGLRPGDYAAILCVTTNDPAQSLVEVPVELTVTVGDEIFRGDFE